MPDTTTLLRAPQRHVFVYGTLRRGQCNDITLLRPAPRHIGMARVPGRLYHLGAYPGLVLDAGTPSGNWVVGEVYAIAPVLEPQLDVIEGILPCPNGEYAKRSVAVLVDAERIDCLVYEVNPGFYDEARRIERGDWLHGAPFFHETR
ncbi:gamma-glutamylcyclotransferase [Ramlibacter sp. H39-3-26]|uniref:gamma-glutamylcyclotransferase family protein n=1 Tax=Curvibacter soli TaxID=3031331 RepID=UPI0023DA23B4|nr:gamma-glutamylcyclotransferase family protein [Ramlibacter sp. H39-3-26]MDF1483675.1 gamma-glutamylcyclotransferase [Ramlibacter sp. H39-3-26]